MAGESYVSSSEKETIMLGEQFAGELKRGDVVTLVGELGAGKTEFVKGVCNYFAVEDLVTSPTFSIINQYAGVFPEGDAIKIYHVDLYRIENPEQLAEIGFDDMVFAHDALKLVEWPAHAADHLPDSYWRVSIDAADDDADDDVRNIRIERIEAPASP